MFSSRLLSVVERPTHAAVGGTPPTTADVTKSSKKVTYGTMNVALLSSFRFATSGSVTKSFHLQTCLKTTSTSKGSNESSQTT
ncbi:hypothetical protein Q1695_005906 [Nippostrongylus brasiliensis]|nr:hypothetical protein Q1695_005906 [Nippostrongylus brasiliensis]